MRGQTACLVLLAVCLQTGHCKPRSFKSTQPESASAQVELLQSLLNESVYPEHSRPSKDLSKPTKVNFGLELNAIIDMDEPSQILKTQVSVILSWIDEFLSWNEDQYRVKEIRIPSSKMWIPDVTLLNSANSYNFMLEDRLVRIKPSGRTEWRAFVIITSFCKINFAFFPYDEQICRLRFRAWTYPREQVVFTLGDEFNADDAEENGEWHIVNMESNITNSREDHGNFSDYNVAISLRRRPQFYVMNIIVPCLIIYCLTLFSFCLPCDSGEKIGLGITILLSLTVFMLISADMMPPTSDNFPLIGQFYTATMVLVAASVGMSVTVLNFNHRPPGARRAPAWMRRLLLRPKCSRFISLHGVQSFEVMQSGSDVEHHQSGVVTYLSPSAKTTKSSCLSDEDDSADRVVPDNSSPRHPSAIGMVQYPSSPRLGRPNAHNHGNRDQETCLDDGASAGRGQKLQTALDVVLPIAPSDDERDRRATSSLERLLTAVSADLGRMVARQEERKDEEEIVDEWKLLAKAVDRLFLRIFVGASVILTVVLGSEMLRRQ